MDKNKKFLLIFAKRFELTLMVHGIKCYNSYHELKTDLDKKICYPLYTHSHFFEDYKNKISSLLLRELQNSISVFKPRKIKNYDIFLKYSDSMYDSYSDVVLHFFNDMLIAKDANIEIAFGLKNRTISEIQNAKNSSRKSIELILDTHNMSCENTFKENMYGFILRTLEQFPSFLKPHF